MTSFMISIIWCDVITDCIKVQYLPNSLLNCCFYVYRIDPESCFCGWIPVCWEILRKRKGLTDQVMLQKKVTIFPIKSKKRLNSGSAVELSRNIPGNLFLGFWERYFWKISSWTYFIPKKIYFTEFPRIYFIKYSSNLVWSSFEPGVNGLLKSFWFELLERILQTYSHDCSFEAERRLQYHNKIQLPHFCTRVTAFSWCLTRKKERSCLVMYANKKKKEIPA